MSHYVKMITFTITQKNKNKNYDLKSIEYNLAYCCYYNIGGECKARAVCK